MNNETKKRLFTREEVKNQKDPNTNWFILHDTVYDVAKFLNEHPGGEEILAEQKGKDASETFDDVGHSGDAKELMLNYVIGELVETERSKTKPKKVEWAAPKVDKQIQEESSGLPIGLIGIAVIILILAYNLGFFSSS